MLPKNIHFVWIENAMPEWVKFNISEFRRLNPDHLVLVHDESILLPEYKDYYDRIEDVASKSDLLRLCALKQHGGWYFDTDFWAFRPVADIEHAYRLDGSRLFLARQTGNMNPEHTIANGIIGIGADNPIIDDLLERVLDIEKPYFTALGPQLVKQYATENRHKVVLGDAEWFFPANITNAVAHYERIKNGYTGIALTMHEGTGNQSPFVMHLWAGGESELVNRKKDKTLMATLNPDGNRLAGLVLKRSTAEIAHVRPDHPMRNLADGLAELGYRVEVRTEEEWPCFTRKPDLIAVWNGMKSPQKEHIEYAEREGIPVYRVEHGWFDRKQYHQCDPQGILHWSSIVKSLNKPAPDHYRDRLIKVLKHSIKPVVVNKSSNTILVIGQTAGDTQLSASEIQSPLQLDKAVCRAISDLDINAVFRPHPLDHQYKDREHYLPTAPDEPLADALAKARFVITINSNAGVEALAHGRPVICFGPATYEQAKCAWKTTKHDLRMRIQSIDLYEADQQRIENYLYWLAGKQWSLDEFSHGVPFLEVA